MGIWGTQAFSPQQIPTVQGSSVDQHCCALARCPALGGWTAVLLLAESQWWLVIGCHQYLRSVTWSPSDYLQEGVPRAMGTQRCLVRRATG